MPLRYRAVPLALVLSCALAACGDDGGTAPEDSDPVLAKQSGDAQSADPGETLPAPIVVRVTRDGNPLSGQSVSWAVTSGGGSVTPTTSTTDANGDASTTWTLGASAGANALDASVTGATGSPQTFTATAEAPPPATANVGVEDNFFDPNNTRVAVGGTVTWTWNGAVGHNVTFSSGPNASTRSSGTFSRDFPTAGSFGYVCTIHSGMAGTVVVETP